MTIIIQVADLDMRLVRDLSYVGVMNKFSRNEVDLFSGNIFNCLYYNQLI